MRCRLWTHRKTKEYWRKVYHTVLPYIFFKLVGNDSLNSGRVELVSSMQLQNFVVVTIDIRISQNAFEISCDDRKKLSTDVLLKACSDEVGGHLDVIF